MSMFTVQTVRELRWMDAEHTMFECVVKYAEFEDEHPTGVSAIDHYEHIQTIWANAIAGNYGSIAEYVPPPEPEDELPVTDTGNGAI